MRPEVRAAYRSPAASLAGAASAQSTRRAIQAGPICLIPRQLDRGIAAAFDDLLAKELPGFDVSGAPDRVRPAVEAALPAAGYDPLLSWLRDDILTLLDLYATSTGSQAVRIRLQAVDDDMCRAFHVDNVAFRLVTTYRGPGTQWLAPSQVHGAADGQPLRPQAIRELQRGMIAILRGGKGARPERPGLLHRSPPIAGTGITRLFLAINETV